MGGNGKRHVTDEMLNEGEEAGWIVTYADLITLLLVFFILLFAISSLDVEKFKRMALELQKSFGAPTADSAQDGAPNTGVGPDYFQSEPPKIDVPLEIREEIRIKLREDLRPQVRDEVRLELKDEMKDEVREELIRELKEDPDEKLMAAVNRMVEQTRRGENILVTQTSDKITITVEGQVFFGSGAAQLNPEARPILDQIVEVLRDYPNYRINIKGHTDDNPISTPQFPSNWELSATRAATVLRYLVDLGVAPERLTATGYGDLMPIAPNDTPENRARNRRVEFVLEKEKKE